MSQLISSQWHKRSVEAQKGTPAISTFTTRGQTEAENFLTAELQMAMLIAKKNIQFSSTFSASVPGTFLDSVIARKYSLERTKTTPQK